MCNWFNLASHSEANRFNQSKEDLWFKGLKYAEQEFMVGKTYLDGLFALETELYYIGFSQRPFDQGIRDYYKHVKNNYKVFGNHHVGS